MAYRLKALPLHTIISNNTFKVTICDLKNKDRNMADNIEHQDKGELVANCDRFNSLKHSTVRSNVHNVGSIKDPNGGYGYPMIKDYSDFLKGQQKLKNK